MAGPAPRAGSPASRPHFVLITFGDAPRIVSLIASATEIVHALGFGDDLVGRSHECDFPPDVLRLPAVSRPAFPTAGPSRKIDLAVKERLAMALS